MKDIFLLDVDDTLLDFHRAEREQLIATLTQSGIAGCTILGDGNISIILDVSNLYVPV